MGAQSKLSPEQMYQLKSDLWEGMGHMDIMEKWGISYQMSVLAKAGKAYANVPWPDGSMGKMAPERKIEIANQRGRAAHATQALHGSERATGVELARLRPPTMQERIEAEQLAHKQGFTSVEAMVDHYKREVQNEKHAEQQAKHEAQMKESYEREQRWLADPYAPEFAKKHGRPPQSLPDDQCDPDANSKYEWDEVLFLTQERLKLVNIANTEPIDPALQLAIRIVFKLLTQRQWDQDHTLRMVYGVKQKIEKFWEENPERAPKEELEL